MWLVWVLGWAWVALCLLSALAWLVPPPEQIRCLALRPSERSWPEALAVLGFRLWIGLGSAGRDWGPVARELGGLRKQLWALRPPRS